MILYIFQKERKKKKREREKKKKGKKIAFFIFWRILKTFIYLFFFPFFCLKISRKNYTVIT